MAEPVDSRSGQPCHPAPGNVLGRTYQGPWTARVILLSAAPYVPMFARLTPQQEQIVLTLAQFRLSERLPRDSFGVQQRDGRLVFSAPEPLSVDGDLQDLFPIQDAGYLVLRRE